MVVFPIKKHIKTNNLSGRISSYFYSNVSKHPFLFFGLPFISIIVGASFFLTNFTQARYDYQKTRLKTLTKQDELKLEKDKKPVSLQEEYWRLLEKQDSLDKWEPKRVDREE